MCAEVPGHTHPHIHARTPRALTHAHSHTHACTLIYCTQSLTGRLLSPSPGFCNWLSLFTNVAPSDSHISSRLIKRVGVTMSACVRVCAVYLSPHYAYVCIRGSLVCPSLSCLHFTCSFTSVLNEPTDAECVSGRPPFNSAGVFSH